VAGQQTLREVMGNLELNMITKRIDNIPADEWPWIMGNMVSIFTIESSTPDSITATGSTLHWDTIYIPASATVTTVE